MEGWGYKPLDIFLLSHLETLLVLTLCFIVSQDVNMHKKSRVSLLILMIWCLVLYVYVVMPMYIRNEPIYRNLLTNY